MAMLNDAAATIAGAAGWTLREQDSGGVFHFYLAGDLHLELLSPEGRTLILRAEVSDLPESPDDAEAMITESARLAVVSMRARASVLSLSAQKFILHRLLPLRESLMEPHLLTNGARDFLNDLSWWRPRLSSPARSPQVPQMWSSAGLPYVR